MASEQIKSFINKRDHTRETPLLYHCRKGHFTIAKILLDCKDVDVHATDLKGQGIFHHLAKFKGEQKDLAEAVLSRHRKLLSSIDVNGFSPLHYAALYGSEIMIKYFIERAKCLLDELWESKCGLTPLDLAADFTTYKILQTLKSGESSVVFQWRQNREIASLKPKETLEDWLETEGIGFIPDSFKVEVDSITAKAQEMMKLIKAGLDIVDPILAFNLTLAGSVNEGTKVGAPDEFDFVCKIKLSSELMGIQNFEPGNRALKATHTHELEEFFNNENFLLVPRVFKRFYFGIQKVLCVPELWDILNNFFRTDPADITGINTSISNLHITWCGSEYPLQEISVDIVPAVECIDKSEDAPTVDTNIEVVCKHLNHAPDDLRDIQFQVSTSSDEGKFMKEVDESIRTVYKICKIVRHQNFCPERCSDMNNNTYDVSKLITSYMLKNTIIDLHRSGKLTSTCPREAAILVYQQLLRKLKQKFVPMFFIPKQNILSQYWQPDWHSHWKLATLHCQEILRNLRLYQRDDCWKFQCLGLQLLFVQV